MPKFVYNKAVQPSHQLFEKTNKFKIKKSEENTKCVKLRNFLIWLSLIINCKKEWKLMAHFKLLTSNCFMDAKTTWYRVGCRGLVQLVFLSLCHLPFLAGIFIFSTIHLGLTSMRATVRSCVTRFYQVENTKVQCLLVSLFTLNVKLCMPRSVKLHEQNFALILPSDCWSFLQNYLCNNEGAKETIKPQRKSLFKKVPNFKDKFSF